MTTNAWEYKVIVFNEDDCENDSLELNGLGQEGWELVSVTTAIPRGIFTEGYYSIAYLKRPKLWTPT